MRFDLVSIFPQFFDALDLSLMGKAKDSGAVQIVAHDLRDWTQDRHRTVDDSPYGGGAGMVMRADIWGKALDEILRIRAEGAGGDSLLDSSAGATGSKDNPRVAHRVLAVPTPSGKPLTQRDVESLCAADQIVVACGRYEGIDQRVVDYYAGTPGVEVFEYSIGDYVLNGGEVAAIVLVEAVARLLDGFMGNPASLDEESFEGNVLEYPSYTRPQEWRGLEVPDVLMGGNHAQIESWRRGKSLAKTARVRPDLIDQTNPQTLSLEDREVLTRFGWIAPRDGSVWQRVTIRPATAAEADEIAQVAAATFPDACPAYVTEQAQAEHIANNLSSEVVASWLADPNCRVLVAVIDGRIEAYTLVIMYEEDHYPSDIPAHQIEAAPTYISKLYVTQKWRGSGLAGGIFEAAIEDAKPLVKGTEFVLGTAKENKRARSFYRRHGFVTSGKRVFMVGDIRNVDVVMTRPV
ncbi:tRNA (guanosine(37)-N1)-methyltransferase TrmD [Actinomyces urinae]|uniref:tRNA (guanosine(37)-N1)-methyltransferase TrmD n=1 Tax=Actinomyces urinae TaxID=1689268 RepID=UPI000931D320|nr:tRNA (guanosine(37)-N1)-methyltransferase TrmD [Actinomyces urinae]